MKRRVLLVDDDVAVLLTMKAVLEISGFEVETAASAREGMSRLKTHEYAMVITDMRMESDAAGREVVAAARAASYQPAVALLTAFPLADEDWQELGADKMLVKPMQTQLLLKQIERMIDARETNIAVASKPKKSAAKKAASAKNADGKKPAAKAAARRTPASTKAK